MEKIKITKAGDKILEDLIRSCTTNEKYTSDFRWCLAHYVLPATTDNRINRILGSGIISGMAGFLMNGTLNDPDHRDYNRFTLDLSTLWAQAKTLHKAQGTVLADLCWAGKEHNLEKVYKIKEKYCVDWTVA